MTGCWECPRRVDHHSNPTAESETLGFRAEGLELNLVQYYSKVAIAILLLLILSFHLYYCDDSKHG